MTAKAPIGDSDLYDYLADSAPDGVRIDRRYMMLRKRGGAETVLIAVLEGFGDVPPRDYAEGVEFAFGYFDMPGQPQRTPAGCYLVRATVRHAVVGMTNGVVEFLDHERCCVASLPALFRLFSLDKQSVPDESGIEIAGSFGSLAFDDDDGATEGRHDTLYIKCHENGGWICWEPFIDSL